MATTSNPFRRKQDVILGIDVSNHVSRPTSQATLSRQGTMRSIGGKSVRTLGSISTGISQIPYIPEEQDDDILTPDSDNERDNDSTRFMDIRRETESLFSRGSRGSGEGTFRETMTMSPDSESFDPFGEAGDDGEDEEDEEEYDSLDDDFSIYAGSMMAKKRAASKRMKALRDGGSALRSSSALGFRSSSTDATGMSLPSKAERMLGMAVKPVSRARTVALRPQLSKSEKGGLPSKAQRLLGVGPESLVDRQRFPRELQKERESSVGYGNMTMNNRSASDVDDFRRILLAGDKSQSYGMSKAGSTSDASSLSRNSLIDSQTSRSSRELFPPDADIPGFTTNNSTWMGIHPAFRGRKPSSDWDGASPVSPFTAFGKDAGYSGKMVVSDFNFPTPNITKITSSKQRDSASNSTTRNNSVAEPAVELHGGPPSPVELPGSNMDVLTRSLPEALAAAARTSSAPSSPLFGPRSTPATAPMIVRPDRRAADDMLAPSRYSIKKNNRPSAIFDNPNIFEMPAEPVSPPRKSKRRSKQSKGQRGSSTQTIHAPPTPPPSDKHNPNADESPSSPLQSPHPPPTRPLPIPPQRRKDSDTLAILPPVAFDKGRQRQHSEDVPISPRSVDPRQISKDPLLSSENGRSQMRLDKFSVPSPLEIAIAEGRPITKTTPPPLPSPDNVSLEQHRAALQEKKRVELSDRSTSRPKQQEDTTNANPESRPFSWQSTRTARSMTTDGDAPPLPSLALKIPPETSARTAASKLRDNVIMSATPLTANSARSRASRLEKALETALSKDGLNMALSGERIEDLFRSAGANELFASGIGPRTEGLTEEEDEADAKQTATKAQGILAELQKLQKEVDQLRKLYAVGGPLEGQSPIV